MRAQPQPRQLLRRRRAGRLRAHQPRAPASACRPTRCCRRACSRIATRSATALGVNHHQIPVNAARGARCTATTATAPCASTATTAAPCTIEPNSFGRVAGAARLPRAAARAARRRRLSGIIREDDADYYEQPGDLFRLMKPEQQQVLFDNTARAMRRCAGVHQAAAHRQLQQGRSGLWGGGGEGVGALIFAGAGRGYGPGPVLVSTKF